MKNLFKHIILFVAGSIFGLNTGYAQLYPVQLTPVFNTPYSVKLSDYATSMDTKMRLMINPVDITISNRQVRLKLSIKGNGLNIQSSDYIQGQQPIFINGGEFQTLTNTDLAALFRLENLQGISALQYANGLPEGMYDFCFEMYDFVTNQKISQKSCAMMYLQLNDPPLLNTPQKNEQISATDFPNILFTWTPRNINATNVSYKFELKQLMDPTMDPQFAFQMSPILYEETLFGTALMYNLNMSILTPGMRYAWRVRAVSTTGLSENSVFKNDGYSEIYSFKYTASCAAPTFLLSEAQGPTSVKVSWQGILDHTRYQIQYKKQDVRNAQWFSTNSLNTQSLITNLEPGVTYQFRVGSSCDPVTDGIQSFTYSGISTFTTATQTNGVPAYNCGIIPKINIQNQKPLTNLIQSETFTAGDFPVTVLELKGENSPYSGRGYIIVPYLADTKIAVEFNSIVVNTDYQLISGVVETSYNPDWKNVTDVEDFTGEGAGGQIEEEVPFEIKDIVIDANGDIVVNGKDGEQVTIPGGKDTVITDGSGKVYPVDSKGNGTNEGMAAATGGKSTPANTDGVDKNGQATEFTAKGISIAFSPESNSKYAFDALPDNLENIPASLQNLYKKVGKKPLPYKAVLNGDTDTLLANVTVTDTNIKLDSIVFKTQNGANIDFKRSDKVFVLTVKGNQTYAEEQILATIKQGDKWKVIGAFMLVHISPKEVNVALVPTYDISQNELDAIIEKTQKTYSKVGVKINFKKEKVLNIESVVSGNTIQTERNTLTSTYSAEQQNINSLYQGTDNSYVLFITDKESSTGQQGYMRLNGQFGYVFKSGLPKTPAHELGHGIFKLEHPFELYKTKESSTDLLMDYSITGTVLNHQDWKQINDPAFKLYAFQGQSSGESADYQLAKNITMAVRRAHFNKQIYVPPLNVNDGQSLYYKKVVLNNLSFDDFTLRCVKNTKQVDASKIEDYIDENFGLVGIKIDSKIFIKVKQNQIHQLKKYFEQQQQNALIFVNGYRFSSEMKVQFENVIFDPANFAKLVENPDANGKIDDYAIDSYWDGVDTRFINILDSRIVKYADGHHTIKTSNHQNMSSFANSTYSSFKLTPAICGLNTNPNNSGFNIRRNKGKTEGENFEAALKKSNFDKATEKIDIVCHSMGYASALGIIDYLKPLGYKFGRMYIIAPENAQAGSVDLNDFEPNGVWQYGADLNRQDGIKPDPCTNQDGVAPQTMAKGLYETNRVYIPATVPKGFLNSHSISNFNWIFNIQPKKEGYVTPR